MGRIYYDTEFLEDGKTISLISIGMVTQDGQELYRVNRDFDLNRIAYNDWMMANVMPSLPVARDAVNGHWFWNDQHADGEALAGRWKIRDDTKRFILAVHDPHLWAWYGAYDHVVLAQLFGRMIDLPEGVPMYTNDLKQECDRLGNPRLPGQVKGEAHNALADARWNKRIGEWLQSRAAIGIKP